MLLFLLMADSIFLIKDMLKLAADDVYREF